MQVSYLSVQIKHHRNPNLIKKYRVTLHNLNLLNQAKEAYTLKCAIYKTFSLIQLLLYPLLLILLYTGNCQGDLK